MNRRVRQAFDLAQGRRPLVFKATAPVAKPNKPVKPAPPSTPFETPPDGASELGKTARGKVVHASGAETAGYNDADHADAGKLHARAYFHHDGRADMHTTTAAGDSQWTRAEEHHHEGERHRKLADHHHDLARLHLTAAGKADHVEVDVGKDAPTATRTPVDAAARAEAKKTLATRAHHQHPGGLTDHDRTSYAGFGGKP